MTNTGASSTETFKRQRYRSDCVRNKSLEISWLTTTRGCRLKKKSSDCTLQCATTLIPKVHREEKTQTVVVKISPVRMSYYDGLLY